MKTVIGVFSNKFKAEATLDTLESKGYEARDLSVIVKDGVRYTEHAGVKGGSVAEGAISGAAAGSVLGGLAGILIGLGALTIPGVGVFLIGGPIAAALGITGAAATAVSAATTGALAGGLLGGMIAVGIPDEEAKIYEQRIKEGAVLLAVPVALENRVREVKNIFRKYQADQVRIIGEIKSN